MISSKFKQLVKEFEKTGWAEDIFSFPHNLLIDKETGEPKKSPKNMKLFGLVQMILDLPKPEYDALVKPSAKKIISRRYRVFYRIERLVRKTKFYR